MTYSKNQKLEELILDAISSIESGKPNENLTAMVKNTPTHILLASPDHDEYRYQPGHTLVTYNGIDKDGNLIQETWGGGVAEIKENSVILKNAEPIKYKEDHKFAGQEVKGFYKKDGTFVIDQEKGTDRLFNEYVSGETTLFNEYVTDFDFVKDAYGVSATTEWQSGLKLQPSYVFKIPSEMENVKVATKAGVEISLTGGDYIIIDSKKGKVISVHGCEKSWLDKTYVPLERYLSSLKK
jgi:hypothetical protein